MTETYRNLTRLSRWNSPLQLLPAFPGDDVPHRRHVELVLLTPGILFEQNKVSRRQIGDSDAAGVQVTQAGTELVERVAAHTREDVQVELLHHANGAFLRHEILRGEFACPAFSPAGQAIQQPA